MRQTFPDIEGNLLLLVAEGNESAFSELFLIYKDKLYSFIFRLCESSQQAEDIVQDVFLRIWMMRSDLAEIRNFEHYLLKMSRNHSINVLKRKALELVKLSEIRQPALLNLMDEVQFRETETIVRHAIEALPNQQRQVFKLSREQGLNQEEISEKLHIAVPTVKSHMTQALRFLRARCKGLYPIAKSVTILIVTYLAFSKKSF